MMRSLYSGVSGLLVHQKSMDVIGNNIANVNTIGFKSGRAVFADMISQTLLGGKSPTDSTGGTNPRQVGLGAYLQAVDTIMAQGTLTLTQKQSDLSLSGNGFFMVSGSGNNDISYTRAGDFNFDRVGKFTNPNGLIVQGWMADPVTGQLQTDTGVGDIVVGTDYQVILPKQTSNIKMSGVLDNRATASELSYPAFMTYAKADASIFGLESDNASSLGLQKGEPILIRADATSSTNMTKASLVSTSGSIIPLQIDSTTTLSFKISSNGNTDVIDLKYSSAAGATNFTTLKDFGDAIAAAINTVSGNAGSVTSDIVNGMVELTLPAAGSDFLIESISGSSTIESMFGNFIGTTVPTGTILSSEALKYQDEIVAGIDFNTLQEFTDDVQNSLRTNVASNFKSTYLENMFGLKDGDLVRMDGPGFTPTGVATSTAIINLQYTDDPAKVNTAAATGSRYFFNDLNDLAASFNHFTTTTVFSVNANGELVSSDNRIFDSVNTSNNADIDYLSSRFSNTVLGPTAGGTVTSTGMSFNDAGKISYMNYRSSTTAPFNNPLTNLEIIPQYANSGPFASNVLETQGINLNDIVAPLKPLQDFGFSRIFLDEATADDKIIDMFSNAGTDLDFASGSSMELNVLVDGKTPTNGINTFSVGRQTRLDELTEFIEDYLGLGASHNKKDNVFIENGQLKIIGEQGSGNNIDLFSLKGVPEGAHAVFNNTMLPNFDVVNATGGRLVTTQKIIDSQGFQSEVKFDFAMQNREENIWYLTVSTLNPDAVITVNNATTNTVAIKFNTDGSFAYMYDPNSQPISIVQKLSLSFNPNNGAARIDNINIALGAQGSTDGLVVSGIAGGLTDVDNDGYVLGELTTVNYNDAGQILGSYSNGVNRVLAQLGIATFTNAPGLMKAGDTLFSETPNSGPPAVGTAGTGKRGTIMGSTLENSNVQLSEEFVTMIVTQRGFQANSRTITTSDEMLQEVMNMKR